MLKKIAYLFLFFLPFALQAQVELSGVVLHATTKEPIQSVYIKNSKGNEWTLTNEQGKFSLELASDNYKLFFSYVGFVTKTVTPTEAVENTIEISLQQNDLSIDEVVISATPVEDKVGSAIEYNRQAIEQVQGFSISEVLSQLPGQIRTNPNIHSPKDLSLRTASSNTNNPFGLSVVVDGMPVSNDETYQNYFVNPALSTDFEYDNSTTDLRQIPASNVEKIEVISGIPDAKYGNLTTGVINIERKAGRTPYILSANLNGGTSSLSFLKGFSIGNRLGDITASVDYLNSNADPRNPLQTYNRISNNLSWSVIGKEKQIQNTLSLNFSGNFDDVKVDEEDGFQESSYRKDRKFSINNRFSFQPKKSFFDQVNTTIGYSFGNQHSYTQRFLNSGGLVLPQSFETGLNHGSYSPVTYLMKTETFGKPVHGFLNSSLSKTVTVNQFTNHISVGLNLSYSDNKGKGQVLDNENPHTQVTLSSSGGGKGVDGTSFRPQDYQEQLFSQWNLGAYLQNNFLYTFPNEKELYAKLGFRFDSQNGFPSYSPRINLGYEITNDWSVRGGIGHNTKSPSLSRLYPGKNYYDFLLRDFRTSNYSWNLIQTYVIGGNELDLEASKVWKYELGTNLNAYFGQISATAYVNKNFDGFTSFDELIAVPYPNIRYEFEDAATTPPTYTVTSYEPRIIQNSITNNAFETEDKGIELLANFNKIDAINTSFSMTAAYTNSQSQNGNALIIENEDNIGSQYAFGVYDRSTTKNSFFRSNINASHHISELALLISITAEQMWRNTTYPDVDNPFPIGYYNQQNVYTDLPNGLGESQQYIELHRPEIESQKRFEPFYSNYHLRASKEFKNGLSMNVYGTNFLNYRPVIFTQYPNSDTIDDEGDAKNSSISFGATIRYKIY